MQMVNNYLDNVESHLPDKIKEEIRGELEASIFGEIDDKEAELERKLEQAELQSILKQMGHPRIVASSFLPNQQLINSRAFPAFKQALQIALFITLGIKLLIHIPILLANETHLITSMIILFWNLIDTGLWVFALVVIVFYLIQRNESDIDEFYEWSPGKLKSVNPKLAISRAELFFEVLISVLFLSWWNNLIGVPASIEAHEMVSNLTLGPEWVSIYLIINITILAHIMINVFELIRGSSTKYSLASAVFFNLCLLVVGYKIFQFDPLVIMNNPESLSLIESRFFETIEFNIRLLISVIAGFIVWDSISKIKKVKENF